MQELMKMNSYSGGGRGWGGQPQPQRANRRGGQRGGGQFRGGQSRFENQAPPRQQPQQPAPAAQPSPQQPPPQAKQPDKVEEKPVPQPTPNKPTPPVAQTLKPEPATPVQNAQIQNKPNNVQQQNNQPPQQNNTGPQNQNSGPDNRNQNSGPDNRNQNMNKRRASNFGDKPSGNFVPGNKPGGNMGPGSNAGPGGNVGPGGNFGSGGNFGPGGNFGNKQGGNFSGPGNKQGGNFGGPGNKQGQGNAGGGPPRNQRGGPRGGPHDGKQGGGPLHGAREEQMLTSKLKELTGPLTELPPLEQTEVKFNGRSRLYIGNLSNEITEEEIQELFSTYGETSELFVNKEKNFAFIRMDYRANAEKAKRELDCSMRRGRPLRVRFAPHNSAVRVKNLTPFVSNELLYRAFEIFGKIERAYVKVDERGKTLGEGVVEYARKASALAAIRNCTEKCFFLTASLRPVIVENFEEPDEFDGYQEKNLPKKHPDFLRSREVGPRFSELSSFEHEYGTRWKQLHELYKQKEEALKTERSNEEDKLEAQMEYAKYEHETELLREQLRQREQDRERQKRSWEMAERAAEERREAERVALSRQEEELAVRMRHQDDELRRRQQENTLFVQAQRLNSMLDRQEQGMTFDSHPQQQNMDGGYRDQYDMGRGYDDMIGGPKQHWEGARHQEDFPNKRRRF